MLKLVLAGAMALAQSPSSVTFTSNRYVEKMTCGRGSGTGFKIAGGRWLSVRHVTAHAPCTIDGAPVRITYEDARADFAMFEGDKRRGGLQVNCDGYQEGQWYWAIGHANGWPFPQIMPLRYSAALDAVLGGRWTALYGNRVVPGMSGGIISDSFGRVVGVINAYSPYYPISFSRALKDTPICQ